MRRIEPLAYKLSGPPGLLIFELPVLRRFYRYRQGTPHSKEAGGQLFATFRSDAIVVEVATGPYLSDKRSRFRFDPDRKKEQRDIDYYWRRDLHFIGNWHTHPEAHPSPSSIDVKNTQQRFKKSDHALVAFVMVIAGTDHNSCDGLFVGLVDGKRFRKLAMELHDRQSAV